MLAPEVREAAKRAAGRHGYRVEERSNEIVLRHPDAPLYIVIREAAGGISIEVRHESIRDFVREVLDNEPDPRGYIEELLDDASALASSLAAELRRKGLNVRLDARTAAMDILEELEEAEEE